MAQAYAEYPLIILSQYEISRVAADGNGNCRLALPPSDCLLDVQGPRPGPMHAKPQPFHRRLESDSCRYGHRYRPSLSSSYRFEALTSCRWAISVRVRNSDDTIEARGCRALALAAILSLVACGADWGEAEATGAPIATPPAIAAPTPTERTPSMKGRVPQEILEPILKEGRRAGQRSPRATGDPARGAGDLERRIAWLPGTGNDVHASSR